MPKRSILHIWTEAPTPLVEELVEAQRANPDWDVEVMDLARPNPDYKVVLEKVFQADSVEVW